MLNIYDLAIRWSDETFISRRIEKQNGATVIGLPVHLKCPGGTVLLVQNGRSVGATFIVQRIEGPKKVRLAGGQVRNGYHLIAKAGSIRYFKPHELKCSIRWHAIGAMRYLDPKTHHPILMSDSRSADYIDDDSTLKQGPRIVQTANFRGGIPGLPKDHPECRLVDAYVDFVNDHAKFSNDFYSEEGLRCDLFDRSRWRLIEAKIKTERDTIRYAHGQLMDYRRFYIRKPSLGILLPKKPADAIIDYLRHYGVTLIWQYRSTFDDSSDGRWTIDRMLL